MTTNNRLIEVAPIELDYRDVVELVSVSNLYNANLYLSHGYVLLQVEHVVKPMQRPDNNWYNARRAVFIIGRTRGVKAWRPEPRANTAPTTAVEATIP
jgi:hypothetical protein